MKKGLLLLPLIALSGCATRQEVLAFYRKQCLDYGFQLGTPEIAECIKDLEYKDEKLALERRKVQTLENQAWIQQQQSKDLQKILNPNAK